MRPILSSLLLLLLFLASDQVLSFSNTITNTKSSFYKWRGIHNIYTEQYGPKGNKNKVLLIHGFGCSTYYWRATVEALVKEGYCVHALDLLGQGQSDKPNKQDDKIEYSIRLWSQICDDYVKDEMCLNKQEKVVLMGNSLGSLVALSTALGDHDEESAFLAQNKNEKIKGICMFNCGVGLNSRGIIKDPQLSSSQRIIFTVVLNLLDFILFNNQFALNYVLNNIVTKELLESALKGLYRYDPTRVDDELVSSFYNPAKGDGAAQALGQIYTNDPGLTPMELHEKYDDVIKQIPIHLVWGDDDSVTPLNGGVGSFYRNLSEDNLSKVSLDIIPDTGHVPFDDNPITSNASMLKWLSSLH